MKIITTWSILTDTVEAMGSAYGQLVSKLEASPDLLIVYTAMEHDGEKLMACAPDIPLAGATSCLGVMTSEGFHANEGVGLGLLGISDPEGSYGVGVADIGADARSAGSEAILQATSHAGRIGEPPALVWLSGAPGYEEEVLLGIQDILGQDIPIAGGSSADNTVAGHWQQFANGQVFSNAVVVTALYPSTGVHFAFHSGYSTTKHTGVVTRAEGRTLYEINGKPAAHVYNQWTGGIVEDFIEEGGNVLSATTLYPLGRVVGKIGDLPYHRLSHPDAVTSDGALTLFTTIEVGQEIIQMAGTRASLITRAGRVAQSALEAGNISTDQACGALVVYCAGCMLTVQDEMDQVAAEVGVALGGNPFLGTFTFGEQGCFLSGENHHGNLMISVVIFEK